MLCGWYLRYGNSIIVIKKYIVIGKHIVLKHSCFQRPIGLELLISANTLIASTKKQCNHIVLPCIIASKKTNLFNIIAMVDYGVTASFINFLSVQLHGLKFIPMQHLCDLIIADSRIIFSDVIMHTIRIIFTLRAYRKVIELFVTRLS